MGLNIPKPPTLLELFRDYSTAVLSDKERLDRIKDLVSDKPLECVFVCVLGGGLKKKSIGDPGQRGVGLSFPSVCTNQEGWGSEFISACIKRGGAVRCPWLVVFACGRRTSCPW